MRRWYWLGLFVMVTAGQARAAVIDLLFPAYANPCCGAGPDMWASLNSAAGNPNFTLNVIFNPASGPGSSIDPNYLRSPGGVDAGALVDLHAAGAVIFGYVATTYAAKNIATAKAEIDKYFAPDFYGGYVDSIFFDEMSNDLKNVGYYRELRDYVKSKNPGVKVIGNPGTSFINNPSGQTSFTVADYATSMDVLVTFENTGAQYLNNYTAPSWVGTLSAQHFGHLVHGQPTWDDDLVALAAARNAGILYITDDDISDGNPWGRLPTYWDAEISAIAAHNIAAIPEPSTVALLGFGALGMIGYAWQTRRRRMLGAIESLT